MPDTFSHYGPVGILLLIGLLFGFGNLILTTLIGPHREGKIKGMTYEAGMNPIGSARRRFNVRFYMMAMTFLVFDVEIIFLYPWATVFPNLGQDSPARSSDRLAYISPQIVPDGVWLHHVPGPHVACSSNKNGAEGGDRTHTEIALHRILSPVRFVCQKAHFMRGLPQFRSFGAPPGARGELVSPS